MGKLLILDFDGTMTDAEEEGAPFRQGYLEDLAALTGRDVPEIETLAQAFEAEVAEDPQSHGWVYDGQIVAPAVVDPYLRIMPVARKIFDACGCFRDERERTRLLDAVLYKYNYKKTRTAFRAGAGDFLARMRGRELFIVTNSHTDAVRDKLERLDRERSAASSDALAAGSGGIAWLFDRVRGRARKYVVDAAFDRVPETLRLPRLDRPVLLRRPRYFEVLDGLRQAAGAAWSEVSVIGDIFELDLALPLSLGARVGLVANAFTPDYERDYVAAQPRGRVLASLAEIPEWLASFGAR